MSRPTLPHALPPFHIDMSVTVVLIGAELDASGMEIEKDGASTC